MKTPLIKFIKFHLVLVISIQFLVSPLAFSQGSFPIAPQLPVGSSSISTGIGTTIPLGPNGQVNPVGAIQATNNQLLTLQQRNIRVARRASIIQEMSVFGQIQESDDFLGCFMPPAIGNQFDGICEQQISSYDPNLIDLDSEDAIEYRRIAKQNEVFYRNFLEEGRSATGPDTQGSNKCLEQKKFDILEDFAKYEEALEDRLAAFERQFQQRSAEIKEFMDQINDANFLLQGQNAQTGNLGKNTVRFESFLKTPSCSNVIPFAQGKSTGRQSGLRGLRDSIDNDVQKAQEIQSTDFQVAFDQKKSAFFDNFNNYGWAGVDSYSNAVSGAEGSTGDFAAMESAYNVELRKLSTKVNDNVAIISQLQGPNGQPLVTLPRLDQKFKNRANNILSQSNEGSTNWEDIFLNMCLQGSTGGSFASSGSIGGFQYIIENLRTSRQDEGRARVNDYRRRVEGILNADATIDKKLAALEALDRKEIRSGGLIVGVAGNDNNSGNEMASSFLAREINTCRQQYASTPLIKDGINGDTVSYQVAHQRAKDAINEIIDVYDDAKVRLSTAMENRFLKCQGIAMNASPTSSNGCNSSKLDFSNEKFCATQSATCANKFTGCYEEFEQAIAGLETSKQNNANNVNVLMTSYKEQLQGNITSLISSLRTDHQTLKQRFPFIEDPDFDTQSTILPDVIPTLNQALEVELAQNGDPTQLYNNFKQIVDGQIKGALESRRQALEQYFDDRIAEQNAAFREQQQYWSSLASKCGDVPAYVEAQKERLNQENQEYNDRILAARDSLCATQLEASAFNCTDEKLESVAQAMSQLQQNQALTGQDFSIYQNFKSNCGVVRRNFGTGQEGQQNFEEAQIGNLCLSMNNGEAPQNVISSQSNILENLSPGLTARLLEMFAPGANISEIAASISTETEGDPRILGYVSLSSMLAQGNQSNGGENSNTVLQTQCLSGTTGGSADSGLIQCLDEIEGNNPAQVRSCELRFPQGRSPANSANQLLLNIVRTQNSLESQMGLRGYGEEPQGMPVCLTRNQGVRANDPFAILNQQLGNLPTGPTEVNY